MKIQAVPLTLLLVANSFATEVTHPRVHWAATGPADHAHGPRCGDGIQATHSSFFRMTTPADWSYMGGGGSGGSADYLVFDANGRRIEIGVYSNQGELRGATNFEDLGDSGHAADLAGTPMPVHKISIEGRSGYGMLGFRWLENIPPRSDYEGSVLITSNEPDAVALDTATRILGSVRVERCAVANHMIIPQRDRRLYVPEFVGGDPLGKSLPTDPAPLFTPPTSPLLLWSQAQVAYLLPLPEATSDCVAKLIRADAETSRILHLQVLAPVNQQKDILARYAEQCGD